MKITFITKNNFKGVSDNIVAFIVSEDFIKKCKCTNNKCNCPLCNVRKLYNFKGEKNNICSTPFADKTILYFGIGKEKDITEKTLQAFGGKLVTYLNSHKVKTATIAINCDFDNSGSAKYSKQIGDINEENAVTNIAFGMELKNYSFNKYYTGEKLKSKTSELKSINILCKKASQANEIFKELNLIAENVFFARNLISEPANILNPESYADICRELMSLGVEVEVLGEKEIQKLSMGSLLAVGMGSDKESQLVTLKWNGAKDRKKEPIAFVGKGITFDSGGLSLKPSKAMEDMKIDMAGSAVVVSTIRLLAMRKAKVNAVGVVALVENMISGKAQRPGDVVKSMSGQTIEVLNTDAEGRLVLADALYYASTKFKPKAMIDLATLTGAIIVALADENAGLFSNSDSLVKEIESSARNTGENVWRMPISPIGGAYDKMIDSDIADMKNVGGGSAGSITAAQFLQRFIDKHKKWAHIDIAGTAWKTSGDELSKKGATGYGVRLLNDLVRNYYED